uniref:Slc39a-10 n=1 Tax=Schmidtea mediterranea TaxID=79327 RepID=A0A0H3YFC1_SCHMD|nr:slc39a-10 [Schmidtea mediterranea]
MIKSYRAIRSGSALIILAVIFIIFSTKGSQENLLLRVPRSAASEIKNQTNKEDQLRSLKVWIASTISVFIISAVGLLGVAVVPLVQKVFYNKIIQYLVALAVGSLTGDAFLHLIPHAILGQVQIPEEQKEKEEYTAVLKGLVALGGVYFFFMAEKCLSMISEFRAEKRAEEEERQRQLKDPRRSELRRLSTMQMNTMNSANRRGSHLPNSRDSAMFRRLSKVPPTDDAEDGIITIGLSSRAMKSIDNLIRFSELDPDDDQVVTRRSQTGDLGGFLAVPGGVTPSIQIDDEQEENASGEIKLMVPSPGYTSQSKEEETNLNANSSLHVTIVAKDDENKLSVDTHLVEKDDKMEDKKAGHGHGHSHEVPGSIAAVAWMVILGDGLHNFSDGLAIGAAFGVQISGGISTAVAVFCHELPHELGDFAVLLKTGMKVKQALFYNIVSSVLCFLGMVIGIALQSVESASYWIFAITAGTFVYIALVDMLPELNSAEVRPGESRIVHFLIQNLGLLTGVGIMLLIALYEEKIKDMLD